MFSAPLAALSVHHLGRKFSILFTIVPFLVSLCIVALADTVTGLIIGKGLGGVGVAFSLTVTPIYLGEIATDDIRGSFGLYMTVFQNIGILRIYLIGAYTDLWLSSLISALPLLLIVVFYRWIPESPYFLLMKNRKDEAIIALRKLRNCDDVDNELQQIQNMIEKTSNNNCFKEFVTEPYHRRSLFITTGVLSIAQFTGGYSLIFYAHMIFEKAGNVSYNMMSTTKAVMQLLTSIISAYVVDSVGRKPLLIISCMGSAIFMACEGIYFYLNDFGYNVDSIWWLPLFAMVMFNVSQEIGLTSISLALWSELFHPKIKSLAVCINKAYLSFLIFGVGKLFQIISDSLGNSVPFFFFSLVGLLGVIFTIYVVPETKGKSLDDIQHYLKHKCYRTENTI